MYGISIHSNSLTLLIWLELVIPTSTPQGMVLQKTEADIAEGSNVGDHLGLFTNIMHIKCFF